MQQSRGMSLQGHIRLQGKCSAYCMQLVLWACCNCCLASQCQHHILSQPAAWC